jgi:hypothetical protein
LILPLVRIDPDDDNDFDLNGTMIGGMRPEMKRALSELCAYFVKACEPNLTRLRKRYLSEVMKNPPGQYELVISESPADWLIPFRPKYGPDFREQRWELRRGLSLRYGHRIFASSQVTKSRHSVLKTRRRKRRKDGKSVHLFVLPLVTSLTH